MVPEGVRVLRAQCEEGMVYTALALSADIIAHVFNVYMPPSGSPPAHVLWGRVLALVDGLPPEEPLILLGDLNAHIGAMPEFLAG